MAAKTIKTDKKPKTVQVFGSNGVLYSFPQGEGGPIEIRIDFAQAPEPVNYYYAESLSLNLDEEQRMVVLSFGRPDASKSKFAQRIDVVMPMKSLFGPVWTSLKGIESALDKILEASGPTPKAGSISSLGSPAATLFANTIFASIGDGESTFDFYHLSPRDVHLAKTQKKDMQLRPMVRVLMSSVLTKHLFDSLRPHAEREVAVHQTVEGSRRAAR